MPFSHSFTIRIGLVLLMGLLGGCKAMTADRERLDGWRAYEDRDYKTARAYFQSCLDANSTDMKSLYYLGTIDLAEGDSGAASIRLELAYEIYQRRELAAFQLHVSKTETNVPTPTRVQILDSLAAAMDAQNDYPQLLHFLKQVTNQYPFTPDYIRLGKYLAKQDDADAALISFRAAVKVSDRKDPSARIALADFFEKIGHKELMIKQLRYAYKLDPDNKSLQDRIRKEGIVPGPSIALPVGDTDPEDEDIPVPSDDPPAPIKPTTPAAKPAPAAPPAKAATETPEA